MWRFLSRILGSAANTPTATGRTELPQQLQQEGSNTSGTLHRPRLTICVEGNIGSGKTTLLEHFARYPDVEVTREDVAGWCDVEGHNLLHMAYEDPNRWSHLLQTHVQLSLAKGHAKGVSDGSKVKLMERSIHSARYCFLENHYRNGRLSEAEYLVACKWYRQLTAITDCQADLVVYLRTDPHTCLTRVMGRGRSEEAGITLGFLKDLHQLHEDWLVGGQFPAYGPMIMLDASVDLPAMLQEYQTLGASIGGEAGKG